MKASKNNPIYKVFIMSGSAKSDVSSSVEDIRFLEEKKQFAKRAIITLKGASSSLKVRSRVFVYASDGGADSEVWRGFIWEFAPKSSLKGNQITILCYDQLIYFQESEESEFFPEGKSTQEVMSFLCNKWGVALQYSYSSINHPKLVLRGTLSDLITKDILEPVKERTGQKYVILSDKDVVCVKALGQGSSTYSLAEGQNVISVTKACTMNEMVTRVVILGKADDEERLPVEATVDGDIQTYGTLQKIINRDENTSIEDAKAEGNSILKENGKPSWEYEVEAVDIPWIRKGDKVSVKAGSLNGVYAVVGVERNLNIKGKIMKLTLEDF